MELLTTVAKSFVYEQSPASSAQASLHMLQRLYGKPVSLLAEIPAAGVSLEDFCLHAQATGLPLRALAEGFPTPSNRKPIVFYKNSQGIHTYGLLYLLEKNTYALIIPCHGLVIVNEKQIRQFCQSNRWLELEGISAPIQSLTHRSWLLTSEAQRPLHSMITKLAWIMGLVMSLLGTLLVGSWAFVGAILLISLLIVTGLLWARLNRDLDWKTYLFRRCNLHSPGLAVLMEEEEAAFRSLLFGQWLVKPFCLGVLVPSSFLLAVELQQMGLILPLVFLVLWFSLMALLQKKIYPYSQRAQTAQQLVDLLRKGVLFLPLTLAYAYESLAQEKYRYTQIKILTFGWMGLLIALVFLSITLLHANFPWHVFILFLGTSSYLLSAWLSCFSLAQQRALFYWYWLQA